jgi:hypothetical protein
MCDKDKELHREVQQLLSSSVSKFIEPDQELYSEVRRILSSTIGPSIAPGRTSEASPTIQRQHHTLAHCKQRASQSSELIGFDRQFKVSGLPETGNSLSGDRQITRRPTPAEKRRLPMCPDPHEMDRGETFD